MWDREARRLRSRWTGDSGYCRCADTKYVRHIKIQSALLTKFWGRPVFLSAVVLVPEGFDEHPEARFPLMVFRITLCGHSMTFGRRRRIRI
jgi:hypothetical protein